MVSAASRRRAMGETPSVEEMFSSLRQENNLAREEEFRRISRGLPIGGASGDHHYRSEPYYFRLVEIGRYFFRSNSIVKQGIRRLTANVIQDGFGLNPKTGDAERDKWLFEKWTAWAENADACDAAGEFTFAEMEDMAFCATIVDGDIFSVPLSTGHLRWYEAHRCKTARNTERNVQLGILLDETFRKRLEYWFTKEDVNAWETVDKVGDMNRVPSRDADGNRQVFHIYHPERFTQARGASACEPVVPWCSMHEQIQFAKLVQQKLVSCYAIIKSKAPGWKPQGPADEGAAPTREDYLLGFRRMVEQYFPGMVYEAEPGEKLEGFSPNIPNPEFFQQALMILTFIAVNFDLPLAVLLLDPSKTNFSGWRGAIDQARIRFRKMQKNFARRFHRQVYLWKVRQWLAEDPTFRAEAEAGKCRPLAHDWHLPTWSYIEPLTDAQADDLIVRRALASKQRVMGRRNVDYEDEIEQCFKESETEIDRAMAIAVRLNEKYRGQPKGHDVDWLEVAHWRQPQGGAGLSLSSNLDAKNKQADEAPALEGAATDG